MAEQNHTQYYMVRYEQTARRLVELKELAQNFVRVDDEVHSAPDEEDWSIKKSRAEEYTEARKQLLLYCKDIA